MLPFKAFLAEIFDSFHLYTLKWLIPASNPIYFCPRCTAKGPMILDAFDSSAEAVDSCV